MLTHYLTPILHGGKKKVSESHLITSNEFGVEFYENRTELAKVRPLKPTLENAKVIWGFWPTGYEIYIQDLHKMPSIRNGRIIIPTKGEQPVINEIAAAIGRDFTEVHNHIAHASKGFASEGLDFKFSHGVKYNFGLLFINPADENACVQVEFVIPGLVTADRPTLIVKKQGNPDLYNSLQKFYTDLWTDSEDGKTAFERASVQ